MFGEITCVERRERGEEGEVGKQGKRQRGRKEGSGRGGGKQEGGKEEHTSNIYCFQIEERAHTRGQRFKAIIADVDIFESSQIEEFLW